MAQIPILSGIYTTGGPDFSPRYPRNLVPTATAQGISNGYLRPAPGLVSIGTGPGAPRGGIVWNGRLYRVMGTKLVEQSASGAITVLADVGTGGQCSLDYGYDRLAIASGGRLYYWNGSSLSQVTDEDLGQALDVVWIAGYYAFTDGVNLIVTDLTDPTSINPLRYGASEFDPDPIVGVDELRNELHALNRYSIEPFQNVGGDGFPFQRIDGAAVPRGPIGTHAFCKFLETFAFLGSGRNEAPSVYLMTAGDTQRISTEGIDRVLAGYTEAQLSTAIVEARVYGATSLLYIHLPDQTLCFDATMTKAVGSPVWYTLTSSISGLGRYRAQDFLWAYDKWTAADPTGSAVCRLDDTVSTHYGAVNGWDFETIAVYNEGRGAIVHELELVSLTGRVTGAPVVWASYSHDGETYSQERPTPAGTRGNRNARIVWRSQGRITNWRTMRFRGTSDAHIAMARLEARLEPLND